MKKLSFLLLLVSCGSTPQDITTCQSNTIQVIRDCKDPNTVLCTCLDMNNQLIYPNGSVDKNMYCNSECEDYK